MTDDRGLTSAGKRLKRREEDLKLLGLPNSIEVSIDLRMGLAHFAVNNLNAKYSGGGVLTLPDLGPGGTGINIDVDQNDEICALEDISGQMSDTVTGWIKALLKAKKMLDLKESDPAKYQELYGYKTHYSREVDGQSLAICGQTKWVRMVNTHEAWNKSIASGKACQRCQKLV